MTTASAGLAPPARRGAVVVPVAVFAVIFLAGETWAKWWPYGHKIAAVSLTHAYPGGSILDAAGPAGAAPSWEDAWKFTVAYGQSVWIALVAALLIGAAVQTLLPRPALARAFGSGGLRGSVNGTLAALPSLMCTCCSAPVTNSLRRAGASRSSALAYWLANPLLNPAVLVFLALVLPWQFTVTRLAVGLALAVGASVLIARLAPARPAAADPAVKTGGVDRPAPYRFLWALARLAIVLVPEYFVVVLGVGALRGWLLPLGHAAAGWGIAAVLIAAAAGTLLVIPTGAEIPVITALLAAGFATGVAGAVLIALPAVSLPSMVMVGRDLSWRVVTATAVVVMVGALAGAGLLTALV